MFLSSCANYVESSKIQPILHNDNIVTIDIDKADSFDIYLYSSILSKPRVVVLETTDKSCIQRVRNLDIYKDRIYILDDKSNKLFVYNLSGKYLYNIGHMGRGKGEYLELSDFSIDKVNGFIYLWDEALDQALKFNLKNRKFVSKVHNERDGYRSYCMQYCFDKLYVNRTSYSQDGDNYMIKEVDVSTGATQNSYLDVNLYNKGWNLPLRAETSCFCDRGAGFPKYMEFFSDTIIEITKNGLKPIYNLLSDNLVTQDDLYSLIKNVQETHLYDFQKLYTANKIFNVSNFYTIGKYVYMTFNKGIETKCLLYNNSTSKAMVCNRFSSDYVSNDMPYPLRICYSDSNIAVSVLDTDCIPIFIEYCVNKGKLNKDIDQYETLNKIKQNSNPILFIHEYKK